MESKTAKISETQRIREAREKKNLASFLISQRNDGTNLPVYPSGQLWNSMTKQEKKDLQEKVEATGKDWDDYEAEMKALLPPKVRQFRTKEIVRR